MRVDKIKLLLILAIVFFLQPDSIFATQIIDYGFEDWQGFNGSNSPAPGYIFTSPSIEVSGWNDHKSGSIVTTGGNNCENNTAYSGNYYQHVQTSSHSIDSCTGQTASSTNVRDYIGANYVYPTGTRDTTKFIDIMDGPIGLVRFRFRVANDWDSEDIDTIIDAGGGMKFLRWTIGGGNTGDDSSIMIKMRYDYGIDYPRIGIFDREDNSVTYGAHTINWQDGQWHAFNLFLERTSLGRYKVKTFLDDWDMNNAPYNERVNVAIPDYGNSNYAKLAIFSNWGGVASSSIPGLVGMDIDDVEVWDSLPTTSNIRADVDQNQTINTTDAMLTLRNSLGLDMSSTNWQASSTTGDVNCDGSSNSTDAMLILRQSLGLSMSGSGWCVGS